MSAFVDAIVLSQSRSESQQSLRPTDPTTTRRQLPTSVPFWFGLETRFGNRALHHNKRSLPRGLCLVDVLVQFAHQHQQQTSSTTTHNVEPTMAPAVISHSRPHLYFPSSQNAKCAPTLPDGNVRFQPLCCSGGCPLDCTQQSFVLVVAVPAAVRPIFLMLCSWSHVIVTSQ